MLHRSLPCCRKRPGKTLVLFVLLLPVLIGLIGLVIDTGLLLAGYRQAQNAADAAALAGANARLSGSTNNDSITAAYSQVQQYSDLASATTAVNIPPTQGTHTGDSAYVEVFVHYTVETYFIQVLGATAQTAVARAVAGIEAYPAKQTVLLLDPGATPGLSINGGPFQVNGTVAINAQGAGSDQNNNAVNLGFPPYAVTTGSQGSLLASDIRVVGGVDTPSQFQSLSGQPGNPLHAGELPQTDPLLYLPPPTASNGVIAQYPGANGQLYSTPQQVSVSILGGQTVTFAPGVYASISITGSGAGQVTFQPGIYVLLGGQPSSLQIQTGATVTGNGVLFYNTGSDYSIQTGTPDSGDGNASGTDATGGNNFGNTIIQAGALSLNPLSDSSSPFDGLLFYQRRWNTQPFSIQGASSQDAIAGTLYSRWGQVNLQGPGTYNAQFIAGRLNVTPPTPASGLTLQYGTKRVKGRQVYLVE